MSFPTSPTDFFEQLPDPGRPESMAEAISELSRFRIHRAFWILVTVTAAHTVAAEDERIVLADATGGAFAVTLPAAADADATFYGIKKIDGTANVVTVATPGAETIDGAASVALAIQYQSVFVISDGTNYWII